MDKGDSVESKSVIDYVILRMFKTDLKRRLDFSQIRLKNPHQLGGYGF